MYAFSWTQVKPSRQNTAKQTFAENNNLCLCAQHTCTIITPGESITARSPSLGWNQEPFSSTS